MAETTVDPELLKKLLDPTLGHSDLALAEALDRTRIGEPKGLPMLSNKQQRGLPMISPGVQPGTSADLENQLTRLRAPDTLADHPTKLGKIGHVLSKIGNVAADVFAPATMSLIPATHLNKQPQLPQI